MTMKSKKFLKKDAALEPVNVRIDGNIIIKENT